MTIGDELAGHLTMGGYGFGGYWTHCDPNGWYTDFVLQGNWYEDIRTRSETGIGFDTRGWGITTSVETGYVFTLGNGCSLIPQGQLIYQHTNISGGADSYGQIHFGETDEVYGRLGARLAKGWFNGNGRTRTAWLDTNFWSQFSDNATATFSALDGTNSTTIWTPLGGTWAQIGLGLSSELARNVNAFGVIDYNVVLNHPGDSLGGRLGIEITW
jgi:outer membrane autotransporter protein